MGYAGYHTACSDFAQDDFNTFNSLEVGLISKFPLANVIEYDPSPDNTSAAGEPAEERLVRTNMPGIANARSSRGFLAADVPSLGITLLAAHLESSRGQSGQPDHENARRREFLAAAMARFVSYRLKVDATATILIAGDMNVGETDTSKNGHDLLEDRYDRHGGDLYDDTHAIFSSGLIDGLHMASLTKALGGETYDARQFAGVGPIDCMYVVGSQAGDFTLARKSADTFGSDHFAVSVRFLFSGTAPTREKNTSNTVKQLPTVRISGLLPDPAGRDKGNEWVAIKNNGRALLSLSGWRLRDRAGNIVQLQGNLLPRSELKVRLVDGNMPLNNNGDDIELLDAIGRVVDSAHYTADQVSPGREIWFRQ